MYEAGQLIIYGQEGVCRVESIGPVDIPGARRDADYYTLSPIYQGGRIYVPVEGKFASRPIMTREEALELIREIPDIPAEIFESSNPRLLGEHYQTFLKSQDCRDLVRLIRAIYAKGERAARRGRRLGQVDERSMRQAEEKLHGELAVVLELPVKEVRQYIINTLENREIYS